MSKPSETIKLTGDVFSDNNMMLEIIDDLYEVLDTLCKLDEHEVYTAKEWEESFNKARKILAKAKGQI